MAFLGKSAQVSTQPFFGDGANGRSRYAQADPALLVFEPELLALQVGQEFPTGFGVGMGNVIARNGLFSRQFAYSGHDYVLILKRNANIALFYDLCKGIFSICTGSLPGTGKGVLLLRQLKQTGTANRPGSVLDTV